MRVFKTGSYCFLFSSFPHFRRFTFKFLKDEKFLVTNKHGIYKNWSEVPLLITSNLAQIDTWFPIEVLLHGIQKYRPPIIFDLKRAMTIIVVDSQQITALKSSQSICK